MRGFIPGLVAALAVGASSSVALPPAGAAPGVARACETAPSTTAAFYDTAMNQRADGWLGGDVSQSVDIGDGRVLWLFGDTFFGSRLASGAFAGGWRMDRNAALVQKGGCMDALPRHGAQGWVSAADPNHWLWPGDGFVHAKRLHVLFLDLVRTGPGPLDFAQVGTQMATFSLPRLDLLSVRSVPQPEPTRTWGSSVVADGGWVYLYAWTHSQPDAYVARARPARITKPWEYWSGSGWVSGRPDLAVPVLSYGAFNNVLMSRHPAGGFVALAKDHEFLGNDLVAWWAPAPQGPWTSLGPVLAAPATGSDEITYMAAVHPEVAVGGGLLVSWNVNSLDLNRVLDGTVRYGPRFETVPIPAGVPASTSVPAG